MSGINVLVSLLALTSFVLFDKQVSLAADVVLTCPSKWTATETVTLVCEVDKRSFPSKCPLKAAETTIFEFKPEGSQDPTTACSVNTFGGCNFVPGSATECGCQSQNDTIYRFIYQILNATSARNGNWDCTKACFDNNGNNPLSVDISPDCTDVKVLGPGSDNGDGEDDDGGSVGLIVGICCGVVGVVVIGVIVILKMKGIGPFKKNSGGKYGLTST